MAEQGYPLATATWDEAEYKAIQNVVDSGMFSMGKACSSI